MDAPAEAQRRVVGAAEVELVGVVERFGVAVGCALQHDDPVAPVERLAHQVGRLERRAQVELHRAVEAQQLLDRGRGDLGVRTASPPAGRDAGGGPATRCRAGWWSSRSRRRRGGWRSRASRRRSAGRRSRWPRRARSAGRRVGADGAPPAAPRSTSPRSTMAPIDASISSSAKHRLDPAGGRPDLGLEAGAVAAGTPTSSPITAIGSGRANSGMNSTSPRRRPVRRGARQPVRGRPGGAARPGAG